MPGTIIHFEKINVNSPLWCFVPQLQKSALENGTKMEHAFCHLAELWTERLKNSLSKLLQNMKCSQCLKVIKKIIKLQMQLPRKRNYGCSQFLIKLLSTLRLAMML